MADHSAELRDQPLPTSPDQARLRTIRGALGMSLPQLVDRAGMSKASLSRMGRREAEGTITLNSMEKFAGAMHADVYDVVVPRRGLEKAVRSTAEFLARQQGKGVSASMAVEGQATCGPSGSR